MKWRVWGRRVKRKGEEGEIRPKTKMDISKEVCGGVHLIAKNETEEGQANPGQQR